MLLTPQSWDHMEPELTSGFKGRSATHVLVSLSYAEFTNEATEIKKSGFRANIKDVEYGSTVNKRTIFHTIDQVGNPNKGFKIEVVVDEADSAYIVR